MNPIIFLDKSPYLIVLDSRSTRLYTSLSDMYRKYVKFCTQRRDNALGFDDFCSMLFQHADIIQAMVEGVECVNFQHVPVRLWEARQFKQRAKETARVITECQNLAVTTLAQIRTITKNTEVMTKPDMIGLLTQIQHSVATVAMGKYETQKKTYKIDYDKYGNPIEVLVKREVQTHLPQLPYLSAFKVISVMIAELESDTSTGETNSETLARYGEYFKGMR